MTFILFFVLALLSGRTAGLALQNGLATTPMMGWGPFNAFGCNTTEASYRAAADALVHLGLSDLGYKYLTMDCGWQSDQRTSASDSQGQMTWNSTTIPSGIPALGDYVHSLGLLFGLQGDVGYYSCDLAGGWDHWVGSRGYEETDANTFAAWGADFLKMDNCFVVNETDFIDYNPSIDEQSIFARMRNAIRDTTSRSIVYAINDWGIQDPARWNTPIANSWRIADNTRASFADLHRVINQLVPVAKFGGPHGWNDLDLLQVGNPGMTEAEWRTQFSFWAAAKSPLLISTDLTTISQEALDILTNKRIIAINQDSLGKPIEFKRRYTNQYDVWAGMLKNGSLVALLLNWQNTPQTITFNFSDVGLASAVLTDLWSGKSLGNIKGSYAASVEAHGTLVYELASGVPAKSYDYNIYYTNLSSNILEGGASLRQASPGIVVADNIGDGGTITFTGVDGGKYGGTLLTRITYINGDHTFKNSECSNCRMMLARVNGGTPVTLEMPISGMSWDILSEGYLLSLDGFLPGAKNNVTFGDAKAWCPDLYSFEVQKSLKVVDGMWEIVM